MTRFYQNLLGRRPGLSQPLPKAAAPDEAKHWLRSLTAGRGPERRLGAWHSAPAGHGFDGRRRAASSAPKPAGVRPYAHPYYWASFILIGDPR